MSLQALIDQSNKKADSARKAGFYRRNTDKQLLGLLKDAGSRVIEGCRAEYKNGRIADPKLQDALRELNRLIDEAGRRVAQ